jgi:hypothetical protein
VAEPRFLGLAVIPAMGVLLVSSGVVPAGSIGPATVPDAKPVGARSRPEVQRSILENRDKDAAVGLLLLIKMFDGRRGR